MAASKVRQNTFAIIIFYIFRYLVVIIILKKKKEEEEVGVKKGSKPLFAPSPACCRCILSENP